MLSITIIGLLAFCTGLWLGGRAVTHAIGVAALVLVVGGAVAMVLSVIVMLLRLYVDSL